MINKNLLFAVISLLYVFITPPSVLAQVGVGDICKPAKDTCVTGFSCQPDTVDPKTYLCQKDAILDIFGKIQPPDSIKTFIGNDPTGTQGISKFLSNLVALFYTAAGVVLVFMLLWGAWDWLTSEGDKEKIAGARNKIISAVIGILLFAAAFAVISVLQTFTGFTFFTN